MGGGGGGGGVGWWGCGGEEGMGTGVVEERERQAMAVNGGVCVWNGGVCVLTVMETGDVVTWVGNNGMMEMIDAEREGMLGRSNGKGEAALGGG